MWAKNKHSIVSELIAFFILISLIKFLYSIILVTTEALELFTEVIRYFVEEAILRSIEACKQEESGRKGSVDVQHLRQIMGHLMLDFN